MSAPAAPDEIRRVVLVDDHAVVRRGMRQLFEAEADFEVGGEAGDVNEAFRLVESCAPDLVVSDLTLEGRDGLELTKQLHTHYPELPVLIVSMHDELLYARRALAAGARGYVMKRQAEGEIVHAAREVLAGNLCVSEAVRQQMKAATAEAPLEALTDREVEVFMLIGEGYAPRHVAERLSLSVSTVEVYRERLKEKLGLESAAVLVRYAVRWCRDHATL